MTTFHEKVEAYLTNTLSVSGIKGSNVSDKWVEKDPKYIAPHLKVGPGVVTPVVLTVGDPFRCEVVAKFCEEAKELQWN